MRRRMRYGSVRHNSHAIGSATATPATVRRAHVGKDLPEERKGVGIDDHDVDEARRHSDNLELEARHHDQDYEHRE